MKKIMFFWIILVMALGLLSGCGNSMKNKIRNDYLLYLHSLGKTEVTIEDVKILQNYGNYNGAVVVRMEREAYEVITKIQVGGVDFTFSNSNVAIVWHDGQFFELTEAYDNGLLSKANLVSIAQKVNKQSKYKKNKE